MSAIKDARKKAGFTQSQVSQISGIPLGTLRRWEQGVNEPNIDAIVMLADIYQVSTDELLGSSFVDVDYDSSPTSPEERHLVSLYRACSPQGRETMLAMAETTAQLFGVE